MAAVIDTAGNLLADRYQAVRQSTEALCAGLSAEDCNLQAMPDTSPAKWHMAHTTWFFETFVLREYLPGYQPVNDLYEVLFNSYYNGIGQQYPRPQRGLLTRPSLEEVYAYRRQIDASVAALLDTQLADPAAVGARIELGLHHEAQHQELLLTDLKYGLFQNPLLPAYREQSNHPGTRTELEWVEFPGGSATIGFTGSSFCFDNELPAHTAHLVPFKLASRLVTNSEYREFVEAGGYENPDYWLADGWAEIKEQQITQPLYWGRVDGQWLEYSLTGLQPLDDHVPVSHISYFEAQAYANWCGKRLPTESEWETAAQHNPVAGNLLDDDRLHPGSADTGQTVGQLFGDCWEWTDSAYLGYPGYRPAEGAIGEYNGKFMSGQMVLRGGSCLSRAFHIRASYRNFFYPRDRWQCTGIRLAANI